jgi:hypothetical protein
MNTNKFQCELCGNSYEDEMKVQKSTDLLQCYDCLFHMNFNDKQIINGSMGINLTEYINIATKYHNQYNDIPCAKLSDAGGCYICMKLLDIPFELNSQVNLQVNSEQKTKIVQEKHEKDTQKNIQEEYIPHNITIDNSYIYNIENLLVKI